VSLTLDEARARARLITDVSYDIELDVTDRATFGCRTTVRFGCTRPGESTFLELARAVDVTVDGLAATYDGRRIELVGLAEQNEVVVEARIPYVTDGDGMHTFTDPADGETYVSAYLGMDIAQRVYPCFDQNDLKATIALAVRAPEPWTVLANGRALEASDGLWRFATTPPIPPAMFVVCAGPWHSMTWEHAGLPFGWHARRSLGAELERDAAELRRITESCFDHYSAIFEEPYPFDSFDQAFVPGQNWGALETPGCVTYRDEYLPVGRVSAGEARHRGTVIAHEMSHMWFGDLVTMTWWEDTWLQESFADYMGFRVAEDAAGFGGNFADFAVTRKAGAYAADERRSTHPVAPLADEVEDVDAAANNFDAISYSKGGSALRQLVTWLGDDDFLAGVNSYLTRHRFGNATLADFVDALDGASARDVRGWVDAWLRTTGFDTLRVVPDGEGWTLVREGSRPHRVLVTTYDESMAAAESLVVDVSDAPVALPAGAVVLPNAGGETYVRVRLDPESWAAVTRDLVSIPDDGARAVLWATAFDLVRTNELSGEDFLGLVTRHLPREPNVSIVEAVLTWALRTLVPLHVGPDVAAAVAQLAAACEAGLASGPDPEIALVLTRGLADTTPDVVLLQGWLVDRTTHTGIEVDQRLRWRVLHRLATLGGIGAGELEEERYGDGTIVGELGAATAMAALPDADAKSAAWTRMFGDHDVSNRVFTATAAGFWQPEQRELVHPWVARYLTEAPAVATERGQAFSQLVGRAFPAIPLDDADVDALAGALEGDVPTVLRRSWEDRLDDLRQVRG